MKELQGSKFDVILADAVGPCGELLSDLLKTPLVYSLHFCPGYRYEKYSGDLLLPTSYVPVVLSELSDRMTFVERVKNMLQVLYFDFWFQPFHEKSWSQFYSDVLGKLCLSLLLWNPDLMFLWMRMCIGEYKGIERDS